MVLTRDLVEEGLDLPPDRPEIGQMKAGAPIPWQTFLALALAGLLIGLSFLKPAALPFATPIAVIAYFLSMLPRFKAKERRQNPPA